MKTSLAMISSMLLQNTGYCVKAKIVGTRAIGEPMIAEKYPADSDIDRLCETDTHADRTAAVLTETVVWLEQRNHNYLSVEVISHRRLGCSRDFICSACLCDDDDDDVDFVNLHSIPLLVER